MTKVLIKLFCFTFCYCMLINNTIVAQVSVSNLNAPVSENFDGMGATGTAYPAGWTAVKYAGSSTSIPNGGVLNMAVTNGSANAGNIYNAGATSSADRALGSLSSGSVHPRFGAGFVNNTGASVYQVNLSAVMEQWRTGSSSAVNEALAFEYSLNATGINDASATWTALPSMDLVEKLTSATVAAAVDGNDTTNQTPIVGAISGIVINPSSTLWIRWSDPDVSGSDGLYAVDDFSITFVADASASLLVNPSSLSFGELLPGTSDTVSYSLTGVNIAGDVYVTSTPPFSISKDNFSFSDTLVFSPEEIESAKTVYVLFAAQETGSYSGNITHSADSLNDVVVQVLASVADPYSQNFNSCSGALPGGWGQYSTTGDQVWECTTFGRTGNGVQINGFSGSARENVDWLISPTFDLTSFNYPLLSFWSRTRFAGPELQLFVSTDYTGGDPALATWTELNGRFPAINSDVWAQSSEINLAPFKSANVTVAFVYSSTTASAARWTVDDFAIVNSDTPPAAYLITSLTPLTDLHFGVTSPMVPTAEKSFTFSVEDPASPVTVSVSPNFELSKDSVNYFGSLSYSQGELDSGTQEVFVRFNPSFHSEEDFTGNIYFESDNLNRRFGLLTGSTTEEEESLDVVAWNIEWFGSPSLGPTDEAQQLENARQMIQNIGAEIYVFEEISSQAAFENLANAIPGYRGFTSPYVSSPGGPTAQRLAFLYKSDVVDSVDTKGLLTGAAATGLPGYPTNPAQFWSSGRLPYLFVADVTMNNVTQRLHLVAVHAKANENSNAADAQEAYLRRKYDVQVLKDSLDAYYSDVNLILLGDYNDDVDVTVADVSYTESTYSPFATDTVNYQIVTRQLSEAKLRTYITADNVIDHIAISDELFDEYMQGSARIVIPFNLIPDFEESTSDHLPVLARFLFSKPVATIGFQDTLAYVGENDGTYVVKLLLDKPAPEDGFVKIKVGNGMGASYGFYGDYSTAPEVVNGFITLPVPAGATEASFVTVINKDLIYYEYNERVYFSVDSISTGLSVGYSPIFTLVIENESPGWLIPDILTSTFLIYPIPTRGPVTIKYPSSIKSTDQVILMLTPLTNSYSRTFTGTPGDVNSLLNTFLTSSGKGIYIVKLVANNKFYYSKIIKN